jgi:mRNA interferase RelE/StbE
VKYRIALRQSAEKEFKRLGHVEQKRIGAKLVALEENPLPPGAIALQGRPGFRIRIGDYRVLYEVDHEKRLVSVFAIGHRRDVYR